MVHWKKNKDVSIIDILLGMLHRIYTTVIHDCLDIISDVTTLLTIVLQSNDISCPTPIEGYQWILTTNISINKNNKLLAPFLKHLSRMSKLTSSDLELPKSIKIAAKHTNSKIISFSFNMSCLHCSNLSWLHWWQCFWGCFFMKNWWHDQVGYVLWIWKDYGNFWAWSWDHNPLH